MSPRKNHSAPNPLGASLSRRFRAKWTIVEFLQRFVLLFAKHRQMLQFRNRSFQLDVQFFEQLWQTTLLDFGVEVRLWIAAATLFDVSDAIFRGVFSDRSMIPAFF